MKSQENFACTSLTRVHSNLLLILLVLAFNGFSQSLHESILFTSGEQGTACYRIPALCTAPDGSLLAVVDQRVPSCADLNGNVNINLALRKSNDKGKTWGNMRIIVDFPEGESASDPSFIVDHMEGKIFLFFNYLNHNRQPREYRHMVMYSSDNGKTWSLPKDITEEICSREMKGYFRFITSGRGIQTSDGTLLHTLVTLEDGVYIIASKDHGKSWFRLPTALNPADETQIAESEEGNWILSARVNRVGYRITYISKDNGQSYSAIVDTLHPDPGCNAGFLKIKIQDKTYFFLSHIHHRNERKGLQVCWSSDGCQTWQEGTIIFDGSAAYSSITLLPENQLGILYEKNDYRQICFKTLSIDEILNKTEHPQNIKSPQHH
jgi:sialidase-1